MYLTDWLLICVAKPGIFLVWSLSKTLEGTSQRRKPSTACEREWPKEEDGRKLASWVGECSREERHRNQRRRVFFEDTAPSLLLWMIDSLYLEFSSYPTLAFRLREWLLKYLDRRVEKETLGRQSTLLLALLSPLGLDL